MKLFKFKKKELKKDQEAKQRGKDTKAMTAKSQFKHGMFFIDCHLDNTILVDDQLDFLSYVMETVKIDIQYDYLSKYFYETDEDYHFLPHNCFDENGSKIEVESDSYQKVSLKDDIVVSFPWQCARTRRILPAIKEDGFQFMKGHHAGYYARDLDISYITCGNHSIASGIYLKQGIIEPKILDIPLLYPHIDTDGVNWINVHTGEKVKECTDFRICFLYALGKMKYEYAAKQQPQ